MKEEVSCFFSFWFKILRKNIHLIFAVYEFNYIYFQGKSLYDSYISKTLNLLREKGLNIDSEGVFIQGQKLPLVDLAALWLAYLL